LAQTSHRPTGPGTFLAVGPSRVLDTRSGVGAPQFAVQPGSTVRFQVAGQGGVPASGAGSAVLNVTVTQPDKNGYLTVYPGDAPRPTASNVNFVANQTVANLVVAPLAADGTVTIFNGSAGTVQLLADTAGYYLSGAPSGH
jgi:hypothetical protein